MLVNIEHWTGAVDRCALCGKALRQSFGGDGWVTYCPGCGIDFPASLDGYDRWEDWITPDGHYQFQYTECGVWQKWDLWDASVESVNERALPGNLMRGAEWREQQAQRERVAALFGTAQQLSFA